MPARRPLEGPRIRISPPYHDERSQRNKGCTQQHGKPETIVAAPGDDQGNDERSILAPRASRDSLMPKARPATHLFLRMRQHALHDGAPDGEACSLRCDQAGGGGPISRERQGRHGEQVDRITENVSAQYRPVSSATYPATARKL